MRPSGKSTLKELEREIQDRVKDYLRWRQWRIVRHQVAVASAGAGHAFSIGEKGMADLQAIYYFPRGGLSITLWIETKRPGKELKDHQVEWALKERARGALVLKVDDTDVFFRWYEQQFGWLHSGSLGRGQRELLFADVPGALVPVTA